MWHPCNIAGQDRAWMEDCSTGPSEKGTSETGNPDQQWDLPHCHDGETLNAKP